MHNSKLLIIIQQLNQKEFKYFKQYLSNNLSDKNNYGKKLISIIDKGYPKFEGSAYEKEKLGAKIFPDKKDQVKQIRYLFSDITKILESFLIEQELNREPYLQNFFLAKAFRRLELGKLQTACIKNVTNILDDESRRDAAYFHQKYNVAEEQFRHHSLNPQLKVDDLLQQKMDYLDAFYLIEKLKCICEVINKKNVRKVEYDTQLFDEITNYLTNRNLEEHPALNIYYCVLQTLIDNEPYYEQLKNLLKQNIKCFNSNEIDELYTYARNFCIRQCNNNQYQYLEELFELYKDMLDEKVIFKNNYLAEWDFKNITAIACRLKKFEWVNNFIEDFKNKITPENRLNAYAFGKATLYFHMKNFSETIGHLQQVQFTDSYYHTDTKVLLIKSYYELEEIVPLYSLIESFKVLLSRNKNVSERNKHAYLTFIKVMKKLIRKKLGSKMNLDKIREEMKTADQVAQFPWLIAKIEEMENKKE